MISNDIVIFSNCPYTLSTMISYIGPGVPKSWFRSTRDDTGKTVVPGTVTAILKVSVSIPCFDVRVI